MKFVDSIVARPLRHSGCSGHYTGKACRPSDSEKRMPSVESSFVQANENLPARVVLIGRPNPHASLCAAHPEAALFVDAVSPLDVVSAGRQIENVQRLMEQRGIAVINVQQALQQVPIDRLRELAKERLVYDCSALSPCLAEQHQRRRLEVIAQLPRESLIEAIMMSPTLHLHLVGGLVRQSSITVRPLGNLMFHRDQQIVTARGVVMCSMKEPQRQQEIAIMKLIFDTFLNIKVLADLSSVAGLKLEGGDFLPAGDSAMFGVGIRSNQAAVDYLMLHDLVGAPRVVSVIDDYDLMDARMHLDTFFNIVGDKRAILLEDVVNDPSRRRRVRVWELPSDMTGDDNNNAGDPEPHAVGCYRERVAFRDMDFAEYLRQEGWDVCLLTDADQQAFGLNILNLGNGTILSVHEASAQKIRSHFGSVVTVISVDYSDVIRMNGAIHCTTTVFR